MSSCCTGNIKGEPHPDLETACSAGQYDGVVALLGEDHTPPPSSLNAAARNGHAKIVALLLSKGAEIDRETVWAASPVYPRLPSPPRHRLGPKLDPQPRRIRPHPCCDQRQPSASGLPP
jgi:hypothetical protein